MNLHLTTGPIVSLVAGILILVMPRLLNYIVAIYLCIKNPRHHRLERSPCLCGNPNSCAL